MIASKNRQNAQAGKLFHFTSLGCKVNQAEASYLAEQLEAKGWRQAESDQKADLAIVMTCSVTSNAARQSRQMARRLAKTHDQALIVATGCDVQAEPKAYHEIDHISVVGRSRMTEIPAMAEQIIPWPVSSELPGAPDEGPFCPGLRFPGNGRSRALLKVQDGCNAFCAYCIVPYTRGKPRSLPMDQACAAFKRLGEKLTNEVVLTGVHLGRYGWDLDTNEDLTTLVKALIEAHPRPRIRISSLEVAELTDELVELATHNPRVTRHLHIPLQAGCNKVLKAMSRPYKTEEFAEKVSTLYAKAPDICLGADLLVGLPGEDEASFKRTYDLLDSLPLSYFHVFPYSPRQGTKAVKMGQRANGPEVKKRAAILRQMSELKRRDFLLSQENKIFEAVVEGSNKARTDNYCLIKLDKTVKPGSLVKVKSGSLIQEDNQPILEGKIIKIFPN